MHVDFGGRESGICKKGIPLQQQINCKGFLLIISKLFFLQYLIKGEVKKLLNIFAVVANN